jgi:hypothetical protein
LLSQEEMLIVEAQEKMSIFLVGAAFGVSLVGGFLFLKWIFRKPEVVQVAEELAEEAIEMVTKN